MMADISWTVEYSLIRRRISRRKHTTSELGHFREDCHIGQLLGLIHHLSAPGDLALNVNATVFRTQSLHVPVSSG